MTSSLDIKVSIQALITNINHGLIILLENELGTFALV